MKDVFEPCPLLPVRGHMQNMFSCIEAPCSKLQGIFDPQGGK
jgi:hypothetical protein